MYLTIYKLFQIINMYGELVMDAVPEKVRGFYYYANVPNDWWRGEGETLHTSDVESGFNSTMVWVVPL